MLMRNRATIAQADHEQSSALMSADEPHDDPLAGPPQAQPPTEPRVVHSEELFAGQSVLIIEHDGQHYRLQITPRNRLLLQK